MKKRGGQPTILPVQKIKEMVDEYLTSDKSLKEVGDEYGVSPQVVQYHSAKRRKEEGTYIGYNRRKKESRKKAAT